MERQPLDSLEYESTYLELRPDCERLTAPTNPQLLARLRNDVPADPPIASYGRADFAARRHRTTPTPRRALASLPVARAVSPASGPPTAVRSRVSSGQLPSRLPRSRTLVGPGLVAVASASLGVVADLDLGAARGVFVALTGVLLVAWARLAWRGKPRAGPYGAAVTRVADRVVTALGTFFATALGAKYAPHASAGFSRTVVLALCVIGLISGLVAASLSLDD